MRSIRHGQQEDQQIKSPAQKTVKDDHESKAKDDFRASEMGK